MIVYEAKVQYRPVGRTPGARVNNTEKVIRYMDGAFDEHPHQEQMWIVMLNRKNSPLGRVQISVGTLTNCLVHPREVLRPVILASAAAFVLVHNHPSGDPAPSQADLTISLQMRNAARVVGFDMLDFIIIGNAEEDPKGEGYCSFQEDSIGGFKRTKVPTVCC